MPGNHSCGSYGALNHGRHDTADMPETTPWHERGEYYVLPDDPLESLNILREAAGLEPLSSPDHSEPEDADGGTRSKGKASDD
jgi:hypothetical protein